jgi:hypothetical protein
MGVDRGRSILNGGGINWTWYCEIDWQGSGRGQVEILRHWRMHNERDTNHPVISGSFQLIEDDNRTVVAILIDNFAVAVSNRKYIFDYPDRTASTPEKKIETRYNFKSKARDLRLGDVIQAIVDSPYGTATVVKIEEDNIHLVRPYIHYDRSIMIDYIGQEDYTISKNENANDYHYLVYQGERERE